MSYCPELFEAIQDNNADSEATIRRLSAAGEDISEQDTGAGSPLVFATALGHVHLVRLLIELGVDLAEPHHQNQMTALHVAAACGHRACLQTLLAAGAPPEARDDQGWTPLMFAAQEGFADAAADLLSAGSEADARDDMDRTVLMQAARCGHARIAEQLIAAGADVNAAAFCGTVITPLIMAATFGMDEVIRVLAKAGADLDYLDLKEGYTALMMAAQMGRSDTVRLLLDLGADVNQQTEFFVTAMTMARRGGHSEIETILLEAGAEAPQGLPLPVFFPWGPVGDPMLSQTLGELFSQSEEQDGSNANDGGSSVDSVDEGD